MDFYCELNFKHNNCYVKSIEHCCMQLYFFLTFLGIAVSIFQRNPVFIYWRVFFLFGFELWRIPSRCDRKKNLNAQSNSSNTRKHTLIMLSLNKTLRLTICGIYSTFSGNWMSTFRFLRNLENYTNFTGNKKC